MKLWTGDPERDGWRQYVIADVFTSTPLQGNQLGVFLDGRDLTGGDLDAQVMQRTARELNLSETVFLLPPRDGGDARIRIFTPATELPFAGHPTLGTAFVLADLLGKQQITLETGVGPIPVSFREDGRGEMRQPYPEPEPYEYAADLLDILGVAESSLPVEAYRNGPRHVYLELPSVAAVANLRPDFGRLAAHDAGVNCFAGSGSHWTTRMFGPSLGVNEDPATGSAAGPLAVHLARHGRIAFGDEIEISQGEQIARPALIYARPERDAAYVAGHTVIVARGEYVLR